MILPFKPYFIYKDLITIIILVFSIFTLICIYPYSMLDPENFIKANPMVTPIHIVPEWYFLFAYCILKSVDNKAFGVVLLLLRVISFPIYAKIRVKTRDITYKFIICIIVMCFIILTYYGRIELN